MFKTKAAQARRIPLAIWIVIVIIIVVVAFLISQVNVNIKEKDIEFFIIAFVVAALGFVWVNMRKDKLVMEGV